MQTANEKGHSVVARWIEAHQAQAREYDHKTAADL
jgi:hypothetical protein